MPAAQLLLLFRLAEMGVLGPISSLGRTLGNFISWLFGRCKPFS